MKLPRWLMIGMLTSSVLLPLAAAGWWWVTWPERTLREFKELVAAGEDERADEFVHLKPGCIIEYEENGLRIRNWRGSRSTEAFISSPHFSHPVTTKPRRPS